jgi:hypothetical protein
MTCRQWYLQAKMSRLRWIARSHALIRKELVQYPFMWVVSISKPFAFMRVVFIMWSHGITELESVIMSWKNTVHISPFQNWKQSLNISA